MSTTAVNTSTFTAADIEKVVDNFAADYSMMAQSTGLRTRESITADIEDLKIFAKQRCLISVLLILYNPDGVKIRAAIYKVSEAASGWQTDRPGNSLWPKTVGGRLQVYATMSQIWLSKSPEGKAAFLQAYHLKGTWPTTLDDTSLTTLSSSAGQQYQSRGYGWERTNYTA